MTVFALDESHIGDLGPFKKHWCALYLEAPDLDWPLETLQELPKDTGFGGHQCQLTESRSLRDTAGKFVFFTSILYDSQNHQGLGVTNLV